MSNLNNVAVEPNRNGSEIVKKQKSDMTYSERFEESVVKQFEGMMKEGAKLSDFERRLIQNLFIKTDISLAELEAKRIERNQSQRTPITWANVDMQKLALDAVHRVRLGLDALIPNHIHPIPYLNGATKKYNVNLEIGYAGKEYYRKKVAVEAPKDIRYELVFDTDVFKSKKKHEGVEVETYKFEITNDFNRGKVIGGFGYIVYEDETKNKLIVLNEDYFKKIEKIAKAKNFWADWGDEMRKKTLIINTVDELPIDPEKANNSLFYVEQQGNLLMDPDIERPQIKEARDRKVLGEKPNSDIDNLPDQTLDIEEAEYAEEEPVVATKQEQQAGDSKGDMMHEITNIIKKKKPDSWYQDLKLIVSKVDKEATSMLSLDEAQLLTVKAKAEEL